MALAHDQRRFRAADQRGERSLHAVVLADLLALTGPDGSLTAAAGHQKVLSGALSPPSCGMLAAPDTRYCGPMAQIGGCASQRRFACWLHAAAVMVAMSSLRRPIFPASGPAHGQGTDPRLGIVSGSWEVRIVQGASSATGGGTLLGDVDCMDGQMRDQSERADRRDRHAESPGLPAGELVAHRARRFRRGCGRHVEQPGHRRLGLDHRHAHRLAERAAHSLRFPAGRQSRRNQ